MRTVSRRTVRRGHRRHHIIGIMKGLAKWLVNLIVVFIVVIFLMAFLLPLFLGGQWIVVMSGSMTPALEVGGLVLVRPIDLDRIKVGDIIAYKAPPDPDISVAHRVIEIQGGFSPSFKTKGDANEEPDHYTVRSEHVKGKVDFHVPQAGYGVDRAGDFVRTSFGLGLLMGLPGALVIMTEVRNILSTLDPVKQRWRRQENQAKRCRKRMAAGSKERIYGRTW